MSRAEGKTKIEVPFTKDVNISGISHSIDHNQEVQISEHKHEDVRTQ